MSNLFDYIRDAKKFRLTNISDLAKKIRIDESFLEFHGRYKAKVSPKIVDSLTGNKKGKYIIVTAVVPTKFGEGKTTTAIGLSMALNKIGKNSVSCLRQPSLGPLFGVKGGATGGGMCQVIPPGDINFFLVGDFSAIEMSHNLIASFLYNHIHYNKSPKVGRVLWNRVMDINDRSLRRIKIKFHDQREFQSGFELTAASEIMAIVALSKNYADLIKRMESIIIAEDEKGNPITTKNIGVSGPATVLLRKVFWPNLLQTCEGTPCLMHTGPFGNIAHGNSSIVADMIALGSSDYVVTEGGFGAELGFEKFLDIKCRASDLWPDCAVVVATARAAELQGYDVLGHTINIVRSRGIPCAVAINRFTDDTDDQLNKLKSVAISAGADSVDIVEFFTKGSEGGISLAESVRRLSDRKVAFKNYFYSVNLSIDEKIRMLARKLYLAEDIELSKNAAKSIKRLKQWKLDQLPICVAKNHFSLSHDPQVRGIPKPYKLPVVDIEVKSGAGFIYVLCGKIMTMPGLPPDPVSTSFSLNSDGELNL